MPSEQPQGHPGIVAETDAAVSFGPFTLDVRGERLLRDGVDVPLTPKAFQALRLLIERPGELVTKEEFLATLWAGTFVEEANLSTTIWMLRRALKDDGQIITTVPKRGYRFSGQITAANDPLPTARGTTRSTAVAVAVPILILTAVLIAAAAWTRWHSAATPVSRSINAIAVLPLADLSADGSQRFVADGLTELLITELARTTPIRVTSRTSSRQVARADRRLTDIAAELRVDAIVEGAVLRSGDQVRVTVQLVDAVSERHLWAETYEGQLSDVLPLQQRVAAAIARSIGHVVAPPPRHAQPIDARAQESFMRGRELFARGINLAYPERAVLLRTAIDHYRAARDVEPHWSSASAAIAQAEHWMAESDPDHLYPEARDEARRAIALDPQDAIGHGALAYVSAAYFGDHVTAEREFRRALELDPSTEYRHGYAMLLSALGRFDEATAMFESALAREPLEMVLATNAARNQLLARHYDDGVARLRALTAAHPEMRVYLARALLVAGRVGEALSIFQALTASPPSSQTSSLAVQGGLICALAKAGSLADARREWQLFSVRKDAHAFAPMALAASAICIGEEDAALTILERGYERRAAWLLQINVEPAFDPIRQTPRFRALRAKMGLPPSS